MHNLTLVIPAKREKESLPSVLEELKKYNLKIIVILEPIDEETIKSISNFDCKIVYQTNKGYGDAIKIGINNVETEYFCIFNADGSFNPQELKGMYQRLINNELDLVFASRYEDGCGSEDDTIITLCGNYIFTIIGKFFFNLNLTDILYTFVMGHTDKVKKLNLIKDDFCLCVELPIKSKRNRLKLGTSKSFERKRISGKKKVNAFRDGLYILLEMLKLFFIRS